MSPEEIAIRQKLKDDYSHYSNKCLKIRSKAGDIKPFTLNRAQKYVHEMVERQRALTGKVRAIVTKGRQQGCCFSPEMRVLTNDYQWIPLADIKIGQDIWSVDENPDGNTSANRYTERRIRLSKVEAKAYLKKEAFEVILSNGTRLVVTGEHRLLFKQRGGCVPQWRQINRVKIGDSVRAFSSKPEPLTPNFEDGWFSGLLDGEGSFGAYPAARIALTQVDGAVLNRAKKYLTDKKIKYYELIDGRGAGEKSKFGDKPVHCIRVDRMTDIIRLLSLTRPSRFINKPIFVDKKLPKTCEGFDAWLKVVSIASVGEIDVIDLQTTHKTFICEGVVSHNSTYIEGRFYWRVTHMRGMRAFILTHEEEATNNLFDMVKRYHDHCPSPVKPTTKTSNAKELVFDGLDSGYKLGTAGNKSVGRSSTIQFLHASEAAFYKHADEHAKGIMQTVPNSPNTEVFIESTANGVGNWFHQQWQLAESGQSEFIAIFIPWFWQDEYRKDCPIAFKPDDIEIEIKEMFNLTNEQLAWRRMKIIELSVNGMDGAKAFNQEYPNTAQEAFVLTGDDNYISSDLVLRARKAQNVEAYGPLIIGVDPARFGDDRTAIIRRQGRKSFGLETHIKKDTMEVTGIVHRIIETERPRAVCVDVGGLGAGIVDRLIELGHREIIHAINSGSKPLDSKKFYNKRAELWSTGKEWLDDEPCVIPDSDELHSDLCNVKYRIDSNSRLIMERKEDMKKRGVRSSDTADAFLLTFALPQSALNQDLKKRKSDIAKEMTATYNKIQQIKRRGR